MHKILEARVRAERIEAWPPEDARVKSLLVAFFKPIHGLIPISERYVDHGNLRSKRSVRTRAPLQIAEELFRFAPSAGCGVGASKICYTCGAAPGKVDRFFEFCDCRLVHLFLEVCLAELVMGESKIRVHFDGLAALSDRFVIVMRKD